MTLVDTETGEILETRTEKAGRLDETVHRGVAAFIEVGCALIAIKADTLYVELGYKTFDAYCTERHAIGHSHRARLMVAATIATELLEGSPIGEFPLPERESQTRPLGRLSDPVQKREAWLDALDSASGDQPTAAEVEQAVASQLSPRGESHGTTIEDLVDAGATVTVKPQAKARAWSEPRLPGMPTPVSPATEAAVDLIKSDPEWQHADLRMRVTKATPNVYRLTEFDPVEVAAVVDTDELERIGQHVDAFSAWWARVQQARTEGSALRLIPGGN